MATCWKEPEEHVPVVGFIHCQETRVALNILKKDHKPTNNHFQTPDERLSIQIINSRKSDLVHVLKLAGVNHSHLSPSFDISALCGNEQSLDMTNTYSGY